MRILGIMSGSSLDGIDMATVVFEQSDTIEWRIENSKCFQLPAALKNSLNSALDLKARDLAMLEAQYSSFIADCIKQFELEFVEPFEYCSIHGHTLVHDPSGQFSWQLVNAGLLSSLAGKHIVSDFRNQDIGLGGLGTPMAALVDRDLFSDYDYCINLGGIANISYYENDKMCAYDICPCNQVHDHFARSEGFDFDENGELAMQGTADQSLMDELLLLAAAKKIPKAIDNSWVKDEWIAMLESFKLSSVDILNTHYGFIAELIANICLNENSKILITGGGAKNTFLTELISNHLASSVELIIPDEELIDYKEAVLMSYMAFRRIRHEENFIVDCTGAKENASAGAIYYYKQ